MQYPTDPAIDDTPVSVNATPGSAAL